MELKIMTARAKWMLQVQPQEILADFRAFRGVSRLVIAQDAPDLEWSLPLGGLQTRGYGGGDQGVCE